MGSGFRVRPKWSLSYMAGFSRVKPSLGNKDTTVDSKVDSGVGSDLGSRVGNLGVWDTPHSLGGKLL